MGGTWQRLFVIAASVCIVASAAVGQELRDRDRTLDASRRIADDLRKARLHYGSFYLLSRLQLADIGYDEEFFVPAANQSAGFSLGIGAPQRLYFTPNKKNYYSVDFDPSWSQFRRNGTRNQYGYRARADAQYLLNHLYLDAYAARANELRVDIGEISSLLTRQSQEVGATGELKYSSRTSMTYTLVARSFLHPGGSNHFQPDLPVNLLDRSEHDYRLALVHKTFPLTSVTIATEYANYSFASAVFKNSRRKYAGAGLLYDSGRTNGRIESGYMRLEFLRPGQRDYRGAVGSASLSRQISNRWTASGALARDVDFSIFANNNYYIASRASIGVNYATTRRLSLGAASTFVRDDYDLPSPGGLHGTEKRRDDTNFTSVGWTYSRNRIRGGFDVGYLKRTSNFPIGDADGIRFVLRLSLTP